MDSLYITALAARKAACEVQDAATKKEEAIKQWMAELKEVCCQTKQFLKMEACLMTLTQSTHPPVIDHDMGDREEEGATSQSSKCITVNIGKSMNATNAPESATYSSPVCVNNMKKQTQISSPSKHYATSVCPLTPGDNSETLLTYFGPGGGADMTLAEATNLTACLSSHTSAKEDEVIDVDMEYNMENDGEVNKEDKEEDDKEDDSAIDGNPGDFMPDGASGDKLSHDLVGMSPMASLPCLVPPPRHVSALRTSSFVPMPSNPVPFMKDAVDADPNFFEGTNQGALISYQYPLSRIKIKSETNWWRR